MTAAKRATAKRLSLDSVAMRLAKAESMPGLNLAEQAGQRRFGGSQASLASSTLTIATNPPPATSRDHAATGGKCDMNLVIIPGKDVRVQSIHASIAILQVTLLYVLQRWQVSTCGIYLAGTLSRHRRAVQRSQSTQSKTRLRSLASISASGASSAATSRAAARMPSLDELEDGNDEAPYENHSVIVEVRC